MGARSRPALRLMPAFRNDVRAGRPKLLIWTFENESAPRCSRRRGFEIDLRRYLLLRTNYCSPLEERVDRRPAGPRSLPLKNAQTGRAAYRKRAPIVGASTMISRVDLRIARSFEGARYFGGSAAGATRLRSPPVPQPTRNAFHALPGCSMSASIAPCRRCEAPPVPITRGGREAVTPYPSDRRRFDAACSTYVST